MNQQPVVLDERTRLYHETPIIESTPLTKYLGAPVFLKMENVQQTGSFKIRGISNLCINAVRLRGCTSFISSSGGNAGLAVAYAGSKLKIPTIIFVPSTTSDAMRRKMELEGAKVIVHGDVWAEAHQRAIQMSLTTPRSELIHPFDHPELWEGHSTIITEAQKQLKKKPSVVVCVVGGGGLMSGILQGMHKVGWNDVPLFACETLGAHSFAEAVANGKLVTLPAITSIAKTLGASRVSEEAFAWSKRHNVKSCVVTDKEALNAVISFQYDHQALVEPSCGAGLAILYDKNKRFLQNIDLSNGVLMIVCGGNMVDIDLIPLWKAKV